MLKSAGQPIEFIDSPRYQRSPFPDRCWAEHHYTLTYGNSLEPLEVEGDLSCPSTVHDSLHFDALNGLLGHIVIHAWSA